MGSIASSHAYSNPYLSDNFTIEKRRGRLRKKLSKHENNVHDDRRLLYDCLSSLPSHNSVMRVYSYKEDSENFTLEIERLDGVELFELLTSSERQNLSSSAKASIIRQLLQGLEHLHSFGIVHRDLKPENVMFRKNYKHISRVNNPEIAIVDLDSALYLPERNIAERRIIGTPAYMSPEYLQQGYPSIGADLWAAGIIMYTLLSGAPPFPVQKMGTGPEARNILRNTRKHGIDFGLPCFVNDTGSKELCAALLDFDPNNRIASASEALKFSYVNNANRSSFGKLIHPIIHSAETGASTRAESSEREFSF